NRLVALKVLRDERLGRFLPKLNNAIALQHAHIAANYDVGAGPSPYIATEYIDGPDLGKLVSEQGPLPIDRACQLLRQTALALEHIHQQGLVHLSVKPSNLLVANSVPGQPGTIRVVDVAVACLAEGAGTAEYLAPEQAQDQSAAGPAADVYSLGRTLYYALTGQPPHPAKTQLDLRHHRPEVPAALQALFASMLAKRPQDRPTAAAVARALAPFCLPAAPPPMPPRAAVIAPPVLPPRPPAFSADDDEPHLSDTAGQGMSSGLAIGLGVGVGVVLLGASLLFGAFMFRLSRRPPTVETPPAEPEVTVTE